LVISQAFLNPDKSEQTLDKAAKVFGEKNYYRQNRNEV